MNITEGDCFAIFLMVVLFFFGLALGYGIGRTVKFDDWLAEKHCYQSGEVYICIAKYPPIKEMVK